MHNCPIEIILLRKRYLDALIVGLSLSRPCGIVGWYVIVAFPGILTCNLVDNIKTKISCFTFIILNV